MDPTTNDIKLPSLTEIQLPNGNEEMFNNCLPILNEHDCNEVFLSTPNPNDLNEYCYTMPMENGKIVDLNLPPTPEKDQENRETCTAGSVKSSPTGIIPCQDEFGGYLNFEVLLDTSAQAYRQKWNYSVKLQKIFIDINKVLLLNFKFDYDNPTCNYPVFVRAMPMYSAVDYLKEPVQRCLQHLSPVDQTNKGFIHLDHVIRCDNDNTTYQLDEKSLRRSVVTELRQPEYGSDCSRLSYRFVCKTSCISGMQRRPIIVIFTLEDQAGQVLGRRVLPVKICSCPKRDMEREENETKLKKNTVFRRNKRCISSGTSHHHHHHHNDNCPPPCKVIKTESSEVEDGESVNVKNNTYSLPLTYVTKSKKNHKIIVESMYCAIAGASSLHNITDTKTYLENLKSFINNLD